MDGLSAQAQEARRDYKRKYRIQNREKINLQQRMWRKKNPDKVKEYQMQYWERKAVKGSNIRAAWKDYGITQERVVELVEIVRLGEYDNVVCSAARMANEMISGYILMSIKKNLSYEGLQRLWELREIERMPCGRSDFYGYRRLFFHYLDCALKSGNAELNK